jgi:hypothetical protein
MFAIRTRVPSISVAPEDSTRPADGPDAPNEVQADSSRDKVKAVSLRAKGALKAKPRDAVEKSFMANSGLYSGAS